MFPRKPYLRVALASAALMSGLAWLTPATAGPVANGPAEDMLQDAHDAIDDARPDIARKILETLRATYPGTAEADVAAKDLARLSGETKHAQPGNGQLPPQRFVSAKERDEMLRRLSMRFLTEVGDRVFFAENNAAIGGRARAVIAAQAHWLNRYPEVDVTVIGRADDGTNEADAALLAHQRAKSVEAMLIGKGVDASRIKVEARGMSDPVATCTSPICQAQNRHVESQLRYAASPARLSGGETKGRGADAATYGTSASALAR